MDQDRVKKIVCLIPPHYDFLCATVIDGLKQLGRSLYCSERTNHATAREYTPLKDLLPRCHDCDMILLFSNTDYPFRKQFVAEHNLTGKTVYVDGSDTVRLEDPGALNVFNVCFKRELPALRSILDPGVTPYPIGGLLMRLKSCLLYGRRVFPLPFAAEQTYFAHCGKSTKKDIPVSCTLVPKNEAPKRSQINECIRNLKIPGAVIGPVTEGNFRTESQDRSKDAYFETLARSKISLSYPGLGFDTGRFWEILAGKALLFSPPLQIRMPYPFLEFKHFIPYSTLAQLKDRLVYYLDHEEEREDIADAGHRHLLKYHTSKERAKYLLKHAAGISQKKRGPDAR